MADKSPIADTTPEENHNGNGHNNEGMKGATIPLELLEREDGILSRAAMSANRNSSGVLQTLIRSIEETADYRQELKTANFSSAKKALQAVKAIHSLKACGVPQDEIVDAIIALKAGVNMAFVHEIVEAITHTTFTSNFQNSKKGGQNAKSNSPLA